MDNLDSEVVLVLNMSADSVALFIILIVIIRVCYLFVNPT